MTELPAIPDILKASRELDLAATAAELHGGLCGWLAAGGADLPLPVRALMRAASRVMTATAHHI